MPQYDCILMWDDLAAARQDAIAAAHMLLDDFDAQQFLADHVIAGVKVWRASHDTTDGDGNVVHSYIAKYFALVSVTRRITALENASALVLALDRDKMNARESGYVLKTAYSAALLQDIRFEPVFMGMDVPWGGL